MTKAMIGLVGDLLVDRDDPAEAFDDVREVLSRPDILFGNLEGAYTDDPRPMPMTAGGGGAPAHNLDAFARAGFTVLSLANNHILDVGYDAMLENRERLRAQGVRTCGAGSTRADAHEPAVVEVEELSVAFLAYASVFPLGYEARSDRPGLAPLRAYNAWREPFPTFSMPGVRPLVTSVPDEADLTRLTEDIGLARSRADVVVASFHWGDYLRPYHLTDHERRIARYCVDQGVDMVVGHHHHALRGMEWYAGKPIMYGLGHFVFDMRVQWTEEYLASIAELYPGLEHAGSDYVVGPRAGWPLLPMHEDTRMTVLAWATADRQGISDIGFLPCRLTPDGLVHPLSPASAEGGQVVAYLDRCNATQGLNGRMVTEGAPVVSGFPTMRVVPR